MSAYQCEDYKDGMDCMRMGLPAVSWCDSCNMMVQAEANRATKMVEEVEANPKVFDASARASADLMRWLIWNRLRMVSKISEELRKTIIINKILRSQNEKLRQEVILKDRIMRVRDHRS